MPAPIEIGGTYRHKITKHRIEVTGLPTFPKESRYDGKTIVLYQYPISKQPGDCELAEFYENYEQVTRCTPSK